MSELTTLYNTYTCAIHLHTSELSWRRGVVASVVRRMNEVTLRRARLVLGWVTSQLGQLSLGVAKSSTSFGWGKGWNDISAGWQVTLCNPI